MSRVLSPQGDVKGIQQIYKGMIVLFYGTTVPTGWALCDGTLGTPDLRDRVIVGDTAIGAGSSGGTESATAVTHAGFGTTDHSAHTPTQAAGHSNHIATQPTTHTGHVFTQPADHGIHSNVGAHTHNAHTIDNDGSLQSASAKLTGPTTHSNVIDHTHGTDSHTHTSGGPDNHPAHSGFGVDAHSAHSGFAVDAHSTHTSITQADNHAYKLMTLAYIQKL